jgi:ubiquinone/menaquinone biosynthesis C-methylase UbiE
MKHSYIEKVQILLGLLRGALEMHNRTFHGNERERRKWQNPEEILAELGLRSGSTFIDLGCGEGFFSIPAARIVGKKGRVYALDIDEEAIAIVRKKADSEQLTNLVTEVGAAEEIVFREACADFVFFGIVLHDFQNPLKVLQNARKMLKPRGLLADVDWKKEPMEFGPPMSIRFSETQAAGLLDKAGFKVEEAREMGPYHYLILATLP